MVFGTFDGVHAGHRAFLKEARMHGDHLIVVLPLDHIVEQLKGRMPKVSLAERVNALKTEDGVNEVVIGDERLGVWEVVKSHRPEVIAVGYDQHALKEDLENHLGEIGYTPEIKVMHSYEKS